MTNFAAIQFADSSAIDAFGRLRVSNPVNLWTSEFQYNKHPLYFDEATAINGSVTHLPNESAVSLAVSTDSGSKAIMQTFEYHRYQPGKSLVIEMTFVPDPQQAGTDMRIGYFDDDNGVFLELTGTTINMVRRTKTSGGVVNNKVTKGAGDAGIDTTGVGWNIDQFDGEGPSGITLDLTKGQILWIDEQWLSMGRIRIGFDIDGRIMYAHEFKIANVLDVPSTTTANLPVRWEIVNTAGVSATKTLTAICSTVFSEGGTDFELGHTFDGGNGKTLITGIGPTLRPICSIRPANTLNSITNRVKFILENIEIFANDSMFWQIIYKPDSITSASFQSPVAHSSVQVDIAGTAISGGISMASGYVAANNKGGILGKEIRQKYPFTLDAAGTNQSRSLTLAVATMGGTNKSAAGQFNWAEIR